MGVIIVEEVNFHYLGKITKLLIDHIPIPLPNCKALDVSTSSIEEVLSLGESYVESSYDSSRTKL